MKLDMSLVDPIIVNTLREDMPNGDITTSATIPAGTQISGRFLAKQSGRVCGLEVAARVFALVDESLVFTPLVAEGQDVEKGTLIARVEGNADSILKGERTALNLLQRMSGIATATAQAVAMVQGTRARIADTRKTTPGLRVIEKYAVTVGGGLNHRFNLSDGILIKDNHIAAAGGITPAVEAARRATHLLKIEVETETPEQVDEALQAGADVIMLDNMSLEMMADMVQRIQGRAVTEASGNMGEKDLAAVAATGVDVISIGALTHTVQCMDISLKF
ncbi:MAG: carboxylating nicotinate-nucleotide diphosphorylase [Clostridia bacterium]|nr:carboxylating nicotinate-nucleotide diphosphorylase [Clostridia bacterium]